jgi:hypothetical protein
MLNQNKVCSLFFMTRSCCVWSEIFINLNLRSPCCWFWWTCNFGEFSIYVSILTILFSFSCHCYNGCFLAGSRQSLTPRKKSQLRHENIIINGIWMDEHVTRQTSIHYRITVWNLSHMVRMCSYRSLKSLENSDAQLNVTTCPRTLAPCLTCMHLLQVHRACAERQILELMDHPFLPTLYASFEVR